MTAALEVRDVVASTQDEVHGWGEAGRGHGSALLAREQSAGRGSRGRPWDSARGGLWLSVLLRPRGAAATEVLSLRAGLAVARVLEGLAGVPPVRIKWPNDLMLGDRKVGGILCEARWRGDSPAWVVVGIGLNVANELPPELRMRGTRLAEHTRAPGIEPLAERIAEVLVPLADAPAELAPAELIEFERRDWLRGRQLLGPEPGLAAGVSAAGALRVRTAAGQVIEAKTGSVTLA